MQAQEPRTPWMHAVEETGHVHKARAGDRKALAALLRHYHSSLYRLAFALTRDVRAAVGVTRGTAQRARDGVRYMPEDIRFFPWVAQIVRKLARSQPPAGASASATVAGPRAEADAVELASRLLHTMDGLDSDEQAALALRIVELLPHASIETTLRVAPGKSPALLAAARSHLTARLAGREEPRDGHLTPEHLSANLEGALEGFKLEQVRMHLDVCERCRLLGVRMASTNDVMKALLTHDPGAAFLEALEESLVDRLDGKDTEPIPPRLEREIAAEVERLDAHRWAAVRHALPRPIVAPVAGAPVEVTAVPPATQSAQPRTSPPAHRIAPPPAPKRAPRPAPVAARAPARATSKPARRDVASLILGAAVAAMIVVIAGLYLRHVRDTRTHSDDARGPAAVVSAPAQEPIHVTRRPSPEHSVNVSIAPQPAASAAPEAPAPKAPGASAHAPAPAAKAADASAHASIPPDTAAIAPPSPAAGPAKAKRPAVQHTPAQAAAPATPRGILCGQVRDDAGAPVVGAQVLLADLHVGALTDRHGRFCISVPVGSRTVSVIALGFATQRRVVEVGRTTPELPVTLRTAAVEQSRRGEDP
jgi:DNA-directed RNA polymerase specialized sigma24 family protein